MLPLKRILAPFDWSELSMRAFRVARELAQERGAEVVVLYVLPLPTLMYGPAPAEHLEHMRAELCQACAGNSQPRVEHVVAEGEPAAAIVRAAKERDCDLIVMGTHGRSGLDRLITGSVAEEVIRKASCPVLAINREMPARLLTAVA